MAARLRARGVPVLDADAFAREVVAKGSEGLQELVAAFGSSILLPDGSLDRKALAAMAFADDAVRRRLNGITHPRISALTLRRAGELAARGEPLACYEAALIVENDLAEAFRPLVVVAAPEEAQIARAVARDNATREEVVARLRAQRPLADKVKLADFVIHNDGSLAELAAEVDAVLDAICAKLGVDASRYPRPAPAE